MAAASPGDAAVPAQGDSSGPLESMRLEARVRDAVIGAVEESGGRVTVGDVSARAGVKVSEAEAALNALAADVAGSLEVSNEGDVLYVLPRALRASLASKSWWLRAQPALAGVQAAAAYLVRVSFGTALITSVILVWVTIIAILSSSSSDKDDRRRSSSGYGYGGGYGYGRRGPAVWFDLSDVLWYLDPYWMRRRRAAQQTGQGMSFVEAIFSFVFGDGDPNYSIQERRWRMIGSYIQSKGGVVTAEELAPLLDAPRQLPAPGEQMDEGYVLPALVRFNGSAEVDEQGRLLYRFPDLQKTAQRSAQVALTPRERTVLEQPWEVTQATPGQRTGIVALGAFNLVGVLVLGGMLGDAALKAQLARSSLGLVVSAFPALQVYAASFFAIPAIRWLLNRTRNAQIESRNAARTAFAKLLANPDSELRQKLASAAAASQRQVISDKDIVFSSGRQLSEQSRDWEGDEFDRRLAALDKGERVEDRLQQRRGEKLEW